MGKKEIRPFFKPMKCTIGEKNIMHDVLYISECPVLLLGRDLLHKLRA